MDMGRSKFIQQGRKRRSRVTATAPFETDRARGEGITAGRRDNVLPEREFRGGLLPTRIFFTRGHLTLAVDGGLLQWPSKGRLETRTADHAFSKNRYKVGRQAAQRPARSNLPRGGSEYRHRMYRLRDNTRIKLSTRRRV